MGLLSEPSMAELLRCSEPETASPLLNDPATGELSKTRLQLVSRLTCFFGLLLVFGTVFATLQAMQICWTSLKANFCP
jgi:hypothetical protein